MPSEALEDAIGRLAALFPYGELVAATNPVGFVDDAAREITELRELLRAAHQWIAECAPMGWCAHGADPRVFEDAACLEKRGHEMLNRIDAILEGK